MNTHRLPRTPPKTCLSSLPTLAQQCQGHPAICKIFRLLFIRLWEYQVIKSLGYSAMRLLGYQAIRLVGHCAIRLCDYEAIFLLGYQAFWLLGYQLIRLLGYWAIGLFRLGVYPSPVFGHHLWSTVFGSNGLLIMCYSHDSVAWRPKHLFISVSVVSYVASLLFSFRT